MPKKPSDASTEETSTAQSETFDDKEPKEFITPSTEKAPQDLVKPTSDSIKLQQAQITEEPKKEELKPKEVSEPKDTSEPSVPSIPETSGNSVPTQQQGDDIIMAEVEGEDTIAANNSVPATTQQPSTEPLDLTPSKEAAIKAPSEEAIVKALAEEAIE